MKPHLPIGQSDFSRIIRDGHYYIDKTLLIQEVIDGAPVVLITRPRRFGKMLNMTMMRYFYAADLRSRGAQDVVQVALAVQGKDFLVKQVK